MISTWERVLAAAIWLLASALLAFVLLPSGNIASRVFVMCAGVVLAGVTWLVTSGWMRPGRPRPTLRRRLAFIAGGVAVAVLL